MPCLASIWAWALEPSDVLGVRGACRKTDGGIDFTHDGGWALGKATAPHFICHHPAPICVGSSHHDHNLYEKKRSTLPFMLAVIVVRGYAALYWFNSEPRKVEVARQLPRPAAIGGFSKALAKGPMAGVIVHEPRKDIAPFPSPTPRAQTVRPLQLEGPGRAAQSLGHLVRTLPQGNARSGQAANNNWAGRTLKSWP